MDNQILRRAFILKNRQAKRILLATLLLLVLTVVLPIYNPEYLVISSLLMLCVIYLAGMINLYEHLEVRVKDWLIVFGLLLVSLFIGGFMNFFYPVIVLPFIRLGDIVTIVVYVLLIWLYVKKKSSK